MCFTFTLLRVNVVVPLDLKADVLDGFEDSVVDLLLETLLVESQVEEVFHLAAWTRSEGSVRKWKISIRGNCFETR